MDYYDTALALAESSEWLALHKLIKSEPGRAEELDDFGMMPLHWACTDTNVPLWVIKKLVDVCPSAVLHKNKGGLIPLQIAVKAKADIAVIRVLVSANADSVFEETPAGETALELAQATRLHQDGISYLALAEADVRAAGRAPSRPSGRIFGTTSSQLSYDPEDFDDELENQMLAARSQDMGSRRKSSGAGGQSFPSLMSHHELSKAMLLGPKWRMAKKCHICELKFSYFKARHHCRNCGESVCSTHSNRRVLLPHFGAKTPSRVCILCYDELRENGKPSAVVNMFTPSHGHQSLPRRDKEALETLLKSGGSASAKNSQRGGHAIVLEQEDQFERAPSPLPPLHAGMKNSTSLEVMHIETNPQLLFDENDRRGARPRARTGLESLENYSEMQEQVRELESHVKELLETKTRIQSQLEASNQRIREALMETNANEGSAKKLMDTHSPDLTRISVYDENKQQHLPTQPEPESAVDGDDYSNNKDPSDHVATTCYYLGMALFEKGDYAMAVAEFRKSLALNDADGIVWYNLARALHAMVEFDEAEKAIRRSLELSDKSYSALSLLGKILHANGQHDKSIEVFREALGLMNVDYDSDGEDVGSMTVGW